MPQVYTLRAPENFNYTDGHHSPAGRSRDNQNYEHRGTPSPSLKSTNYLQLPSSPMHSNSNPRATTAAVNKKRRSPILQREKTPTSHLNELDRTTPEYNRRSPSPKSHGVVTSTHSSSRKLVTIYTITSSNDDPFPSQMPRTPPTPVGLTIQKTKPIPLLISRFPSIRKNPSSHSIERLIIMNMMPWKKRIIHRRESLSFHYHNRKLCRVSNAV